MSLRFDLADAATGEPVPDAVILFKDDESCWVSEEPYESATWSAFRALAGGRPIIQRRTSASLHLAHILILAPGYEPARLKLNEALAPGETLVKRVELKPLPPIEWTVLAPDGNPAAGAGVTLRDLPPEEFAQAFSGWPGGELNRPFQIVETAADGGVLRIRHPALARWTAYRIVHPAGYADLRPEDFRADTPDTNLISLRITLLPYATIRGRYVPEVARNEFLEVYRLKPDRMSVDGPAALVALDETGRFQLERRLAGWHSLVHRVRYTDAQGRACTSAVAVHGPFSIAAGQAAEWTLGAEGCPVAGRLVRPAGVHLPKGALQISVDSPEAVSRPHAPSELTDDRARQAWWDAFWESDAGRRYQDSRSRWGTTAADADGRFHFPMLRPGRYVLRLVHTSSVPPWLTLSATAFEVPEGQGGEPIDLGDLRLEARK